MSNIVIISGSPAAVSRTSALASFLSNVIEVNGHQVNHILVRDLPPEALIYAQFNDPDIKEALQKIERADAVIVISPVYKATYTGVIKTFIDLIPEKGLAGKKIFPIATGGTIAHLLSLEYTIKPLFSVLGAREFIDGVYIVDSQLTYSGDEVNFVDSEVEQRLRSAVNNLLALPQV